MQKPYCQRLAHTLALLALVALVPQGHAAGAPDASTYAVTDRWTLPGSGGWDCLTVDPPRHRLFLSRGDRVEVVDTTSGKLIGTVAGTAGVHAIALAPELGRGFTSNGRTNSITVFNYDTLERIQDLPVPGENPDLLLYLPASGHLLVLNGRSRNAVVLDARSLAVLATVPMPGKPEFAVDDGHGQVFVNIESDPGRLVQLSDSTYTVTANWELSGCNGPTGLAMDVAQHRLFSACDDGVLNVIHQETPDHYTAVGAPATQAGARTLAFDPASRRVYTVTAKFAPAAAPTAEAPRPRPQPLPDSFTVLVLAPH